MLSLGRAPVGWVTAALEVFLLSCIGWLIGVSSLCAKSASGNLHIRPVSGLPLNLECWTCCCTSAFELPVTIHIQSLAIWLFPNVTPWSLCPLRKLFCLSMVARQFCMHAKLHIAAFSFLAFEYWTRRMYQNQKLSTFLDG
jgi:hypothetical protein